MLLSLCSQSRPVGILRLEVRICEYNSLRDCAKPKPGIGKFVNALHSFDVEFQPFIEEINAKECVIREFADAATMERIRSMILHLMWHTIGGL